ncbi:MAG: acylneuraminate cytidylyltransferase family protein [Sedimentisphaerales bacterium]|nr:acylneuraminate cytidylyltransferase family protein [Sedimentisphaerales bacterium]
MKVLGLIPARAGSQGLPGKNMRPLLGKPVIAYTIDAALAAKRLSRIAVTTDDPQVLQLCRQSYPDSVIALKRPAELAGNTSRIDDVMRHACRLLCEQDGFRPDAVALLYANVPVRAAGIIDRAIEHLEATSADSVQTLSPVGKFHPYWLYRMDQDRIHKYQDNQVYRRQELPACYYIDSAVGLTTWKALFAAEGDPDPHAFWGPDKRALAQPAQETIDIDTYRDLLLAEAALREKQTPSEPPAS